MRPALALLLSVLAVAPGAGWAQDSFDKTRLLGNWFQVAETPSILNRDCHGTTIAVTTREDSRYELRIACPVGALDGPILPIDGIMVEVANGAFLVRFVRLALLGNLELFVLHSNDTMLVLRSRNRDVGWVWSRQPHPSEALLAEAEAVLVANGYKARSISRVEQAE